jgi:hypothetical protein
MDVNTMRLRSIRTWSTDRARHCTTSGYISRYRLLPRSFSILSISFARSERSCIKSAIAEIKLNIPAAIAKGFKPQRPFNTIYGVLYHVKGTITSVNNGNYRKIIAFCPDLRSQRNTPKPASRTNTPPGWMSVHQYVRSCTQA